MARKIAMFAALLIFSATLCLAAADPAIKMVRKGALKMDPTVTISDALERYKCFGKSQWRSFRDAQNRHIVEFDAIYDLNKCPGDPQEADENAEIQKIIDELSKECFVAYQAQFAMNAMDGESFELWYSGIKVVRFDLVTREIKQKKDYPDSFDYLSVKSSALLHIYNNEPFSMIKNAIHGLERDKIQAEREKIAQLKRDIELKKHKEFSDELFREEREERKRIAEEKARRRAIDLIRIDPTGKYFYAKDGFSGEMVIVDTAEKYANWKIEIKSSLKNGETCNVEASGFDVTNNNREREIALETKKKKGEMFRKKFTVKFKDGKVILKSTMPQNAVCNGNFEGEWVKE